MPSEAIGVNLPTLSVTNSATNYLFDTTAPPGVAPAASYTNQGHGITGASTTPGALRHQYHDLLAFQVMVYCTDQNVTLYFATLLDGATSWTIWNNSGAGQVVTAGTALRENFDCWGTDARVYITNGGTGPTVLQASLKLICGDRGGS